MISNEEAKLQEAGDKLVRREVLCCMSYWVSALWEAISIDDSHEEYDALLSVRSRSGWQCIHCGHFETDEGAFEDEDFSQAKPYRCPKCDARSDDPDEVAEETTEEAYEHWAVDGYLANDLSDRGEMVEEIGGLMIWGRQTTGQAIMMDQVIRDIVKARGWDR